jgi:transposase
VELLVSLQKDNSGQLPHITGQSQSFANTPTGFRKLMRCLVRQSISLTQVHVVMEATNVYWEACAYALHDAGCTVSVVNPAQIKFFAKSTLRRGKTDAMDAQIIARFGVMMRPPAWTPPAPELVEIKQLVRERETVLKQIVRERNHLKALQAAQHATPLAVRLGRQRIALLDKQIAAIEAALKVAFAKEPNLQAKLELLMSVPGYGFVAAATVLAETNAFETLENGHEIAAYAGLAPAPNQSGLSQRRGRISKVGNARLRRIAYMAALGAKLSHSPFKTFYESLRARGKPPKVALVALARKLLRVGLAVVKSGQPYQATYRRQLNATGVCAP